jgi:hypothetical protein
MCDTEKRADLSDVAGIRFKPAALIKWRSRSRGIAIDHGSARFMA